MAAAAMVVAMLLMMMCTEIRKAKRFKMTLCISCNSEFFLYVSFYVGHNSLPGLSVTLSNQITIILASSCL